MIEITQEKVMQNWNGEIPLVSISCITYNHEPYIAQTLDGFLMQKTSFPFEILIHDDASTDRTADIIREYEKKFPNLIKPIYQKENQYSKGFTSVSATWNFPRAKGKYIALCEGDDYWIDENKLQMQVDFLEANPEYGMCFHGAEILKEIDDDIPLRCDLIDDRNYSATELFQFWLVPTASICIKRDIVFMEIKNTNKILNGDIVLVEKAAHSGKVRGFKKKMSVYRMHSRGVTYNQEMKEKRIRAYPNHYLTLKQNFPLIEKKYLNQRIIYSYINIYRNLDKKITLILKAFFISPNCFISMALNRLLHRKKTNS